MLYRQLTSPITFGITQNIVGLDEQRPLPNGTPTIDQRNAVYFDATTASEFYTIPDSASFDLPNSDWFVGGLVYIRHVGGGNRWIASIGQNGSPQNVQIYQNANKIAVSCNGGSTTSVTQTDTLTPDRWYSIFARRSGTNLDCVVVPLSTLTPSVTTAAIGTPAAITPTFATNSIGCRSSSQTSTYFDGAVSYFVVGTGSLSNSEVVQLAQGVDITTLGKTLRVYTEFNSASATITDSSGNGNTANRNGTPKSVGGPDFTGLAVRITSSATQSRGRVWQRQGTSRNITFTGTYQGAPSGIEARIIGTANTQVTPWANCITPTAGNWSVTLNVPQGLSDYILEVRHKDNTARMSRTLYPFGVGDIIMYTGQSNANNMATSGSRTLDMRKHCLYTGNPGSFRDTRVTNLGCGFGEVMFQYQAALEAAGQTIPIMVCNTSASGSSLTAQPNGWQDTSGTVWAGFLSGLAAVGGDVAAIIWHQGEADAGANVAGSLYGSTLQTVVGRMRTNVGRDANNLPFFPWVLGHAGGTTAAPDNWRPIRNELINAVSTIPNSRTTGGAYVLDLVDSLHYVTTQNGYVDLGCMNAQALANYFLPTSYSTGMEGPFVTGAAISGNDIILSFNLNNNSGLFLPIASPSPVDGLVVRNGSAVLQTVSSWAISGNTLVLTMASTPVAGWTVDYIPKDILRTSGAYAITDNDNMIYGTNTVIGTTRRVPARPMTAAITL